MSRLFELLQGVDELGDDYSAGYVTKRYHTIGSVSTLTKRINFFFQKINLSFIFEIIIFPGSTMILSYE
jgi:hypothetical protein